VACLPREYARFVADGRRLRVRGTWTPASVVLAFALLGCSGVTPSPSLSPAADTSAPTQALASLAPPPSASPAITPSPTSASLPSGPFAILPGVAPANFVAHISCTGTIGASDPVALVQLHAAVAYTGPVVLRDYADITKPRTVCTFGNTGFLVVQLIDARHMVIGAGDGSSFAVVDVPEVRFHWFHLAQPAAGFGVDFIAVSPALDRVIWKEVQPLGSPHDVIHITSARGDRVVATVPDTNAGRCGSGSDSNTGGYTRSGSALFILDEPLPEISLLVLESETVVFSDVSPSLVPATTTRPLMALWSPTSETLYYKKSGSIWQWTPSGGSQRFLSGVDWASASISPDGAHLAYAIEGSDGLSDTYLVDLAHGGQPVRIGKGHRAGPVFLNDTQLWFIPQGGGGCTGPAPTGPLVYNVSNGTESPSIIDNVRRVWPATGTHA
jgi:hypothetical protein